jgi:hypothetical protein
MPQPIKIEVIGFGIHCNSDFLYVFNTNSDLFGCPRGVVLVNRGFSSLGSVEAPLVIAT